MSAIDSKLVFSWDQALTTVGTAGATYILNMSSGYDTFGTAAIADYGETGNIWLNVRVTTAFTGAAATASLIIALQSATGLTGTYTTKFATPALTTALRTAGTSYRFLLPPDLGQFVKVLYTVGTTYFGAGNLSTWLSLDGESPH